MRLALSVRKHKGVPCEPTTKEFLQEGGTIGRNASNDLVLQDSKRIVSGCHARIDFRDDAFYLQDVSTNGVFVNGSTEPVGSGGSVRLADGDRLAIGEYELAVAIIQAAAVAAPVPADPDPFGASDPFGGSDPFGNAPDPVVRDVARPAGRASSPPLLRPEAVDPLDLLGGGAPAPHREAPPGAREDHLPSERVHFTPPRAFVERSPSQPLGPESIPDDWDRSGAWKAPVEPAGPATPSRATPVLPEDWDLDDVPAAPRPRVPPARPEPVEPPARPAAADRPASRPLASGSELETFLRAAGLPLTGARPAEDLMRDAGAMLREVVTGLMDLLAARASFKSEFRLDATMIRPADNNPLKFSADATEALEHLLRPSGKAYLEPARAMREAVLDVKDHELAMLAAMRTALESLLRRLHPDELETRFAQQGKKSSLLSSSKGRYWEMYREMFAELDQDLDALFRDVFGEQFTRAYEAQIARLVKARR